MPTTKRLWMITGPSGTFVWQLLEQAGIQPAHGPEDEPYVWERTASADPGYRFRSRVRADTIARSGQVRQGMVT